MSYLYINKDDVKISTKENTCVVTYSDGMIKSIPIETLEEIDIFGNAQVTTQMLKKCLIKGIPLSFYSRSGKYFGRLISTNHVNVRRQRKQAKLGEDEIFKLKFAKKIISAKVNNQLVILKRYARTSSNDIEIEIKKIISLSKHIEIADSEEELIGYEGSIAREYFRALSKIIDENFKFSGRSRRPPRDEFNSLISLGYTLILNEIYGKLEKHGLNPYFGFLHKDDENHPTLASDLIEEWRAVIVDSMVLSLINGHEILKDHFIHDYESGGIYLTDEGSKIFFKKFEAKLRVTQKYICDLDDEVDFRRAIDLQVISLSHAIEENDVNIYKPIKIR